MSIARVSNNTHMDFRICHKSKLAKTKPQYIFSLPLNTRAVDLVLGETRPLTRSRLRWR
jgi:hypothetical protein